MPTLHVNQQPDPERKQMCHEYIFTLIGTVQSATLKNEENNQSSFNGSHSPMSRVDDEGVTFPERLFRIPNE